MTGKLEKLKQDYALLAKKYDMPEYKVMNEEFDIEKAAEQETDTLAREIRKIVVDKAIAYLRFIEMLLNPSNAPMFFFTALKGMEPGDRAILEEVYNKLGRIEIGVIGVDNDYSEKTEAEFVKRIFSDWKDIKESMRKISVSLQNGWEKKFERKDKSYLG